MILLISHASKVMLKILQARLQQYVNQELPYAQAEFKKDRNCMDLTEAEDIQKRWWEYTQELYKKILMTQMTMMLWSLS